MISGRAVVEMVRGRVRGNSVDMCYALPPDYEIRPDKVVCARPRGHGVTSMQLPNGQRTYVVHNTEQDGTGEGWS